MDCAIKMARGSVIGWRGNFLEEVNAEFYAFHNCLNNFIFRNSF
jgi:hypothetical protein